MKISRGERLDRDTYIITTMYSRYYVINGKNWMTLAVQATQKTEKENNPGVDITKSVINLYVIFISKMKRRVVL